MEEQPGRGELLLEDLELEEDEELWTDDDDSRPHRLVLRLHRPVPVPRRRLHVRRRVHDGRAPDPRLAGARRPEPPPPRRAREAGRPQPARRLVRAGRSGRAPRTTRGRPPAGRCTASSGQVRTEAEPTLGVEEELFLVDAETLEARRDSRRGRRGRRALQARGLRVPRRADDTRVCPTRPPSSRS